MGNDINVTVIYALPEQQSVISVTIPEGSSLEDAIRASGLLTQYPEIDLTQNAVGVFSERRTLQEFAQDGDQIEVYRPLVQTAKQARKSKVKRKFKKI